MKKRLGMLAVVAALAVSMLSVPVQAKGADSYPDVGEGAWFYQVVTDVTEKGYMNGYDTGYFGPGDVLLRGQFATVLYNMEGKPQTEYQKLFPDVPDGWYFSEPIVWGKETDILTGYDNGCFGPADQITREQMVTIMYRYAQSKGEDVAPAGSYAGYPDGGQVSAWASDAMKWAIGAGIIQGKGTGLLEPTGPLVRAECAAIISRYQGKYAEEEQEPAPDVPEEPEEPEEPGESTEPDTPEEPAESYWVFQDEEGGSLTERNIKIRKGITIATAAGGYLIAAPDEGINWERDLRKCHKWVSNNLEETLWGGVASWEGDLEGIMPGTDSPLFARWTWWAMSSDERLSFSDWFHKYFDLEYFYELADPYAEESIKRLNINDGEALSGILLTEDEALNHYLSSGYPSVTESDLTVPPVEGAQLVIYYGNGKVVPYDKGIIVSYDVYGGTGQWANYFPDKEGWGVGIPQWGVLVTDES
ncbi:S-layer homology domain-containing protein [uncultured Merdimonas sp.]|uniref:S-layer homology domain-containing protein n=1 Tax=uncultured Merdimonas sp. TaxID=2023269 RepID=UPI003207B9B6